MTGFWHYFCALSALCVCLQPPPLPTAIGRSCSTPVDECRRMRQCMLSLFSSCFVAGSGYICNSIVFHKTETYM